MKTKKIFGTLPVVCLLPALLPTAAFAFNAGSGKTVRLVDKSGGLPAAANNAGAAVTLPCLRSKRTKEKGEGEKR
jgi:hypothetical protein